MLDFTVPSIPVGKGRGSPKKATDAQIIAAYEEAGGVWGAAKLLGMCGQSVHERLQRLGLSRPVNVFTEQDEDRLRREYEGAASAGKLGDLAADMGRTKHFICRQARKLGLTNGRRSKAYLSEGMSERMKQWFRDNSHPRGMLGKSHSQEVREKAALATRARWAAMGEDERAEKTLNQMKGKVAKYGSIAGTKPHGRWKAEWREIGGKRKFFRSRWEANYARYLEWLKCRGEIADWQHEPETFWFEKIKRGVRSYLPDFLVTENDGRVAYHEVKGWMDDRSRTIIKRMAKYHPKVTLIVIDSKQYKAIASKVSTLIEGWE